MDENVATPAGGSGDAAEERRLILRMLEAGRITPEQAVELLKALQAPTAEAPEAAAGARAEFRHEAPERGGDLWRWAESVAGRMGELADELSERVSRAVESAGLEGRLSDMGERLEQLGQTLAERVGQAFGTLGRAAFPEHAFTEELSGTFAEGLNPDVELRTRNGHIRVAAAPPGETGPRTWRLKVDRRIRARTREEAESLGLKLVSVEHGPTRLTVRTEVPEWQFWGPHAVHLELTVPADVALELRASTSNGNVSVKGLRGGSVEARSVNGRLDLADLAAHRVTAHGVNGSVLLDGVLAELVAGDSVNGSITGSATAAELKVSSVNGSVTLRPSAEFERAPAHQRVSARTVNGSVRVVLPPEMRDAATRGDLGLGLEAETGWGTARIEVPGTALVSQTAQMGKQRVVYRSPDFDRAARTLQVQASTRHGSAVVTAD